MPRTVKTLDELDREVMSGGPLRHDDDEGDQDDNEGQEDGNEGDGNEPEKTIEQQLADMRAENARLSGLVEGLGKRQPAQQAQQQPPVQKKPKEKRDWEKMLFEDTEKGVEALKEDMREEIMEEVRKGYSSDQGQKEFWRDFWDENKDLKRDQDADLAQATLQKHYNDLAELPVNEAIKRLGTLTRERIIQYTGKRKTESDPKKKARTEGAGERAPKPRAKEEEKIVSLGDIIRSRKLARSQAQAKAQTA